MNNKNIIDDYLANRLSEPDKLAFESRLSSDPKLKQEFTFHKDVVGAIQEERKASLKHMMDSIPISGATGTSLGTASKFAASVLVAATVIGSIYFLTRTDGNVSDRAPKEEIPAPVEEKESNEEAPAQKPIAESNEVKETADSNSGSEEEATEIKKDVVQNNPAEIKTPNIVDDFGNEESDLDISEPEVFNESDNAGAENLFSSSIEVVTDDTRKRYKFHYRFKDEKLYLFGSFDSGLYEILEFNNSNGKTIILYYKDNYYLLNNSKTEITPLQPIVDAALVDKLENLRK